LHLSTFHLQTRMSLSTTLPAQYTHEIDLLSKEVLKSHPTDVLQFCANYFNQRLAIEQTQSPLPRSSTTNTTMAGSTFPGRMGSNANPFGTPSADFLGSSPGAISKVTEEDESDTITSPTTPSFGFKGNSTFGDFGGDGAGGPPSSWKAPSGDGFPAHYGMGRRTSVSAESLNPTASSNDNWTPPFHQKTPEQLSRLKKSISNNFLFSHLDDEQSNQVLGALVEKPIPAKGIKVSSGFIISKRVVLSRCQLLNAIS